MCLCTDDPCAVIVLTYIYIERENTFLNVARSPAQLCHLNFFIAFSSFPIDDTFVANELLAISSSVFLRTLAH